MSFLPTPECKSPGMLLDQPGHGKATGTFWGVVGSVVPLFFGGILDQFFLSTLKIGDSQILGQKLVVGLNPQMARG